ncbi:hypothetical protein [Paenibacillus foliorum]|uniref:hypothetical protein n=1 Tax=Paenibacillus foliorum TaxID=2654974 RepID=UPI001493147A|nr:hypothetical protein [Paenibacillus foliorum]
MFTKVKTMLKDYFISEQNNDYVYYPTEDGVFAYYYREYDETNSATPELGTDTSNE